MAGHATTANASRLITRLREQRMKWVDLAGEPGKRVRIIRPTESELAQHFFKDGRLVVGIEEVKRFVVEWDGFTEADFLGAAVGSSDPLPFDAALWAEVVADHVKWVQQLAQDLLDHTVAHRVAAADDEKNS